MASLDLAGAWKGAKELEVSKIPSKYGAKELPPGFQAHLSDGIFGLGDGYFNLGKAGLDDKNLFL